MDFHLLILLNLWNFGCKDNKYSNKYGIFQKNAVPLWQLYFYIYYLITFIRF